MQARMCFPNFIFLNTTAPSGFPDGCLEWGAGSRVDAFLHTEAIEPSLRLKDLQRIGSKSK